MNEGWYDVYEPPSYVYTDRDESPDLFAYSLRLRAFYALFLSGLYLLALILLTRVSEAFLPLGFLVFAIIQIAYTIGIVAIHKGENSP